MPDVSTSGGPNVWIGSVSEDPGNPDDDAVCQSNWQKIETLINELHLPRSIYHNENGNRKGTKQRMTTGVTPDGVVSGEVKKWDFRDGKSSIFLIKTLD